MLVSIIIASITIVAILLVSIFKPLVRIKSLTLNLYWIIALLGALILIFSNLLPFDEFIKGVTNNESSMNPLKILILFISMTGLSIFLDELGFFNKLATFIIHRIKTKQILIFIGFYLLVSILTMFTSNDIVILTLTPFIIFFCKRGNISPIPYLVAEFCAANTWSMMFIIGNPTNIYLASSHNIDFVNYFLKMALPTIGAGIVEFLLLLLIFNKKLKDPIIEIPHSLKKLNRPLVIIGLIILFIATIFLVISSYINLSMWLIALSALILLTLVVLIYSFIKRTFPKELLKTYKRMPWELVPFLLAMFAIVLTLEKYGICAKIHDFFGTNNQTFVYGLASLFSANIVNNIPMSILFSSIINDSTMLNAIYASIIGSNIGAFLTPFGALAGIMYMSILKRHHIKFSYLDFMKYGFIIGLPVIGVALFILLII